jgi:hypothetical protein
MTNNYQTKYLKYKLKYFNLLNQYQNQNGGHTPEEFIEMLKNVNENGYLMEIDKDELFTDPISFSEIHKNNAIYIATQIYNANSLSECIEKDYLNNKKLATNPLNRNEYTENDYNLIADHISGLDDKIINKRKEIINEIKNLIQLDDDIQKKILHLKPEQRKIFLNDHKFKIFIKFDDYIKIKLIYTNLLDNRNFQNIDDFEKYLYEKFIKDFELLFLFPEEYMTDNICKLAVRYSGYALEYIPTNKKTFEICKLAIENNGIALKYVVPDTNTITPIEYLKICLLAVEKTYRALEHVLADEMTPIQYYYICEIVVYKKYNALEYVKANKMTIEKYFYICDLAFRHNSLLLQYVPYDLRTFEICKLAVTYYGDALQYVSSGRMTLKEYSEICMIAVEKNGRPLQYIYDIRMTSIEYSEICKIAVENNGRALEYIPTNKKTFEICKLAVEKDSLALEFVKNDKMTIEEYLEICELAVQKNGLALEFVHIEKMTNDKYVNICNLAVKQNSLALEFVKNDKMTKDQYLYISDLANKKI